MSTLKVTSPFDGSLIKEIPLASSEEVENALSLAKATNLANPQGLPETKRIAVLENLVSLMIEQKDALAQIAISEGGKPLVDTKIEVDRAIQGVKLAIQCMLQHGGGEIPMGLTSSSLSKKAFTIREPIGVVVSLSAFNHPLNLIVHQVVPAIAVGCPVIVKPASTTPLSCLNFAEMVQQAGLPKEWCQGFVCGRSDAEKLASDNRVGYLSFIGSAAVGWKLRSILAPGTRCGLEHGGNAPVIVEKDADLEALLPAITKGGFYHAGQVCVSVQRVYVHQEIVEEVSSKLAASAQKLVVGDPKQETTEVGPLISPKEVERVDAWVKEAVSEGAKLLCGGEKIGETCYQPTVLLNPSESSKVTTEEIFGPVVCVYSFSDKKEAIKRANDSKYAFQAAVYTKNLDDAFETVMGLNATAVMVNEHTSFRVDWMPFGGRDHSGLGLGGIPYSMHEMSRDKLIVIKSKAF